MNDLSILLVPFLFLIVGGVFCGFASMRRVADGWGPIIVVLFLVGFGISNSFGGSVAPPSVSVYQFTMGVVQGWHTHFTAAISVGLVLLADITVLICGLFVGFFFGDL